MPLLLTQPSEMKQRQAGTCLLLTMWLGMQTHGAGTQQGDFVIDNSVSGMVNLYGIESPGLTSSLAIAEYVANMLKEDPSR